MFTREKAEPTPKAPGTPNTRSQSGTPRAPGKKRKEYEEATPSPSRRSSRSSGKKDSHSPSKEASHSPTEAIPNSSAEAASSSAVETVSSSPAKGALDLATRAIARVKRTSQTKASDTLSSSSSSSTSASPSSSARSSAVKKEKTVNSYATKPNAAKPKTAAPAVNRQQKRKEPSKPLSKEELKEELKSKIKITKELFTTQNEKAEKYQSEIKEYEDLLSDPNCSDKKHLESELRNAKAKHKERREDMEHYLDKQKKLMSQLAKLEGEQQSDISTPSPALALYLASIQAQILNSAQLSPEASLATSSSSSSSSSSFALPSEAAVPAAIPSAVTAMSSSVAMEDQSSALVSESSSEPAASDAAASDDTSENDVEEIPGQTQTMSAVEAEIMRLKPLIIATLQQDISQYQKDIFTETKKIETLGAMLLVLSSNLAIPERDQQINTNQKQLEEAKTLLTDLQSKMAIALNTVRLAGADTLDYSSIPSVKELMEKAKAAEELNARKKQKTTRSYDITKANIIPNSVLSSLPSARAPGSSSSSSSSSARSASESALTTNVGEFLAPTVNQLIKYSKQMADLEKNLLESEAAKELLNKRSEKTNAQIKKLQKIVNVTSEISKAEIAVIQQKKEKAKAKAILTDAMDVEIAINPEAETDPNFVFNPETIVAQCYNEAQKHILVQKKATLEALKEKLERIQKGTEEEVEEIVHESLFSIEFQKQQFEHWRSLAAEGDAEGFYQLSLLYLDNWWVPESEKDDLIRRNKAVQYCLAAVNQGYIPAIFKYAYLCTINYSGLHSYNDEVNLNSIKPISRYSNQFYKYHQKYREQVIYDCYSTVSKQTQDKGDAEKRAMALNNLGFCVLNNIGVRDYIEILDNNDAKAQFYPEDMLDDLLDEPNAELKADQRKRYRETSAFNYFMEAAKQGCDIAHYNIAYCLLNKIGLPADREKDLHAETIERLLHFCNRIRKKDGNDSENNDKLLEVLVFPLKSLGACYLNNIGGYFKDIDLQYKRAIKCFENVATVKQAEKLKNALLQAMDNAGIADRLYKGLKFHLSKIDLKEVHKVLAEVLVVEPPKAMYPEELPESLYRNKNPQASQPYLSLYSSRLPRRDSRDAYDMEDEYLAKNPALNARAYASLYLPSQSQRSVSFTNPGSMASVSFAELRARDVLAALTPTSEASSASAAAPVDAGVPVVADTFASSSSSASAAAVPDGASSASGSSSAADSSASVATAEQDADGDIPMVEEDTPMRMTR